MKVPFLGAIIVGIVILLSECTYPVTITQTPSLVSPISPTFIPTPTNSSITTTGFYWPTGRDLSSKDKNWLSASCKWSTKKTYVIEDQFHIGTDIYAKVDDPVYAIADGILYHVNRSDPGKNKMGWGVGNIALLIDHQLSDGSHFTAVYGHIKDDPNSPIHKEEEKIIHKHDVIGKIGPYYNGPHLHFGIHPGDSHTDFISHLGMFDCPDNSPIIFTNGFVDPYKWIITQNPGSFASNPIIRPTITQTPLASTETPFPTPTLPASPLVSRLIAYIYNYNVWVMNSDGSNKRQITFDGEWGPSKYRTQPTINYSGLRWSPDGNFLLTTRLTQKNEISTLLIKVKDNSITQLLLNVSGSYDWSPDSKTIVYSTDPYIVPQSKGLFFFNLKTKAISQFIKVDSNILLDEPNWSKDGQFILFRISQILNSSATVYKPKYGIAKYPGRTYEEIPDANECNWSPDNSKFICSQRINGTKCDRLVVFSVSGKEFVTLGDDSITCSYISGINWSPEGTKIAFTGIDVNNSLSNIYVVNSDGSDLKTLTSHPVMNPLPEWSPDGHFILFSDYQNRSADLYLIRVDGKGLVKLSQGGSAVWQPTSLSASTSPQLATSTITPTLINQNQLDLGDPKSISRFLFSLIQNNQPGLISSLMGGYGTDLNTWYGTEFYPPGHNNSDQVITELEEALTDANPVCKGYQEMLGKHPDKAILYIQGLSCKDDKEFCNHQKGGNGLFFFEFITGNDGQWQLVAIGPVWKSLAGMIDKMETCP